MRELKDGGECHNNECHDEQHIAEISDNAPAVVDDVNTRVQSEMNGILKCLDKKSQNHSQHFEDVGESRRDDFIGAVEGAPAPPRVRQICLHEKNPCDDEQTYPSDVSPAAMWQELHRERLITLRDLCGTADGGIKVKCSSHS